MSSTSLRYAQDERGEGWTGGDGCREFLGLHVTLRRRILLHRFIRMILNIVFTSIRRVLLEDIPRSGKPLSLVYSCAFPSREEALQAERQIKGWSRKKKEAMLREDWAAVNRLSRGKHRHQRS